MGKFDGLKKMFQVGEKIFPAASAAEALKIQKALENAGEVGLHRSLVALDEAAPVANEVASEVQKTMAPKAAAIAGLGAMPTEDSVSPLQMMKEGLGKYREAVVDPLAAKLKSTLTPDLNVNGKSYKTSNMISDGILEMAADPVNYIPGVGGAIASGAEMVADMVPEKKFEKTRKLFGQ